MKYSRWLGPISMLVVAAGGQVCHADVRLRDVLYDADEVYRLPAYAGYDTDIQFEAGEHFVGLGTGDLQGLSFHSELNHLFIKPRAANVNTDITVLTDRRVYHFDFVSVVSGPDASHADLLYALRFLYPKPAAPAPTVQATGSAQPAPGASPALAAANRDYWYCGAVALQPAAAWDDGLQTHLRFRARQEMPALFLKNADGSESLLNFHIDQDEVIIHRVVQRLVLRRGGLVGCVVNRAYALRDAPRQDSVVAYPARAAGWSR